MSNSCTSNQYFSGQGSVLIATKATADGEPEGFVPVGNVSALTIGVETTVFQHKESCSGTRGIDKEIVQEVAVTLAMTMESINKENLALALYGSESSIVGATVSAAAHIAYVGKWIPMPHLKLSLVVITDDPMTITYVEGDNYTVNAEAGSIYIMSAAEQAAAGAVNTIVDLDSLLVDYTYDGHDEIEAITSSAAPERWVRFEGLNTADLDNPVVIDVYKASIQPLAELALINEELAEMSVEAAALSDASRVSGSNYFTVKQVTTN